MLDLGILPETVPPAWCFLGLNANFLPHSFNMFCKRYGSLSQFFLFCSNELNNLSTSSPYTCSIPNKPYGFVATACSDSSYLKTLEYLLFIGRVYPDIGMPNSASSSSLQYSGTLEILALGRYSPSLTGPVYKPFVPSCALIVLPHLHLSTLPPSLKQSINPPFWNFFVILPTTFLISDSSIWFNLSTTFSGDRSQ